MTSSPLTPGEAARDDSAFRRPGAAPGEAWEALPDDRTDEDRPTPSGYVLEGASPPAGDDRPGPPSEGDREGVAPRRWRPGMLFAGLLGVLALVGVGWFGYTRWIAPDPEPAPPTPILAPPPSWDVEDMEPPSGDISFSVPPPEEGLSSGMPGLDSMVTLPGDDAVVARTSESTALVLAGELLSHVDLDAGEVLWQQPATGEFAGTPGSGAVVDVAPDGRATSRVILNGEVLSEGRLRGRPALCGEVLLDVHPDGLDAYPVINLAQPQWSAIVDTVDALGTEARHLDCWEQGRWWYVGDRPTYGLRVAPATHEAQQVYGIATRSARTELRGTATVVVGRSVEGAYPGSIIDMVEAGDVLVVLRIDGGLELSGLSAEDPGLVLWTTPVDSAWLLQAGDRVYTVQDSALLEVDPRSGGDIFRLDAGSGTAVGPWAGAEDIVADGRGNLCAVRTADAVGVGELSLCCEHPDSGEAMDASLDGRSLILEDDIWVLTGDGTTSVFQ